MFFIEKLLQKPARLQSIKSIKLGCSSVFSNIFLSFYLILFLILCSILLFSGSVLAVPTSYDDIARDLVNQAEESKQKYLRQNQNAREIEVLKEKSIAQLKSRKFNREISEFQKRSDFRLKQEGPQYIQHVLGEHENRVTREPKEAPCSSCRKTNEGVRRDELGYRKDKKIESDFLKMNILEMNVFVSFSMPEESLRAWVIQAHQFGANVYLRGLVDNSFPKTAEKIKSILKESDQGGFSIHPMLFREEGIKVVPTVVVRYQDRADQTDRAEGTEAKIRREVIRGDIPLEECLSIIQDNAEKNARRKITKEELRKKNYEKLM